MDGLGFRVEQGGVLHPVIRCRVEWFPSCWLRCRHGCGLFDTAIVRISLAVPGGQVTLQLCRPCLERVASDRVFAKEVAACL